MKARTALRRTALSLLLGGSALSILACPKYTGPGTTVTVTNNSGSAVRNLEVNFARVGFGVPGLATNESHTHWIQPGEPCHVKMKFEDASGRAAPEKQVDFGQTCPRNIALEIDAQNNVTGKAIQK